MKHDPGSMRPWQPSENMHENPDRENATASGRPAHAIWLRAGNRNLFYFANHPLDSFEIGAIRHRAWVAR
jgi:hypothetical protein